MIGLALQVVGFLTTGLGAPRFEVVRDDLVIHGNRDMMLVGLLVFGLGGAMSLVAVVGFGVLLGLRARAEERPPGAGQRSE